MTVLDSITITSETRCGSTVVTVAGEIDVYTAPALRDRLAEAAARTERDVVCDLSAVTYVDSTAIGVLVGAFKKVRTRPGQREMRMVAPTDPVRTVLRLTGLDRVFALHATADDALAAVPPDPPPAKDPSP
ncbi:STAS domain-containing protein [Streptomyces yaizuensis]|uniref:Anti-sigma factor antagonist n=1 Tax=Streptomyces yaizuensis TaxID=2989713 RepID=A0ABQ5P6A4_9ACTN|nr:STAS domain-containing protein [Streptomyces sp. YSPA8]GLF98119.1 anti-sigma factor antagonist [Streptomyces sp. YSPA8]